MHLERGNARRQKPACGTCSLSFEFLLIAYSCKEFGQ